MILSRIFKIVSISYHGKKVVLARAVEFDTFTLSAHEVLRVEVVVLVFFSAIVVIWVAKGFFISDFHLEVVLVF
jgi:hypothetical protein